MNKFCLILQFSILFLVCSCLLWSQQSHNNSLSKTSETQSGINNLLNSYALLIHKNDRANALQTLRTAEELAIKDLNNNATLLATIYASFAEYNGIIGDRVTALEYAKKCIHIRRQYYNKFDPEYTESLFLMARFSERIGDYEESEKYIDTLISTKAGGDSILLARSHHLLSLLLIRQNDYESAKKYATIALSEFNSILGDRSNYSSYAHQELGTAYSGLEKYDKAMFHYKKAYSIRKEIHGQYHRLTLSTNTSITRILIAQGDTIKALEKNKQIAQDYLIEYDIAKSDKHVLSLIEIGEYYAQMNYMDSAEHYYLKALRISEKYYQTGDRPFVQAYHNLSSTVNLSNRVRYSSQALYHLTGNTSFHELDKTTLPFMNDRYSILRVYQRHAKNLFLLYEAGNNIEYLIELLSLENQFRLLTEEVFMHFLSSESIVSSAYRIREVCLLRLRSSHILYEITGLEKYLDTAIRAMEESKNLVLQSQLFSKNVANLIEIPDSIIQREKSLVVSINKLKTQQKQNRTQEIESELLKLETEYLNSRRANLLASEKYRKIVNPLDISIDRIKDNLDKSTILLDYFLDGEELYLIYISQKNSGMVKSAFTDKDETRLDDYIQFVKQLPVDGNKTKWNLGHYFYNKLIPIRIDANITKAIVLPDNNLSLIPFDLILSDIPDSSLSVNQYPFLIKQLDISYLSGIHGRQFNNDNTKFESVLAMAPFISTNASKQLNYPPLIHSKNEIESISNHYKSVLFMGTEATKTKFKTHFVEHDIIHIASHAVIDKETPINSNIIFYPTQGSQEGYEDKLAIWELHTMDINSSLAILSACQTSSGAIVKGEGLTTIARGFYTAGTNTVISNLWPVQDFAASHLMKSFYKNLVSMQSPSAAMRQAKLNYLNSQIGPLAHPMYWAGWMVHQSDIRSSSNTSSLTKPMLVLISLASIGLLFILFNVLKVR